MTEIDWVDEASRESFPASDAPAWPVEAVPPALVGPRSKSSRLEGIAYHEAGHTVVGLKMGLDLLATDILPDGAGGRGHTQFARPGSWFHPQRRDLTARERDTVDRVLVTFLAGFAAESRIGAADTEGSGYDVDEAVRDWIALLTTADAERQAALDCYLDRARSELEHPGTWPEVETVARRLLSEQYMDGAKVRALIRAAA
jgi:ATP-dependent Zn protease